MLHVTLTLSYINHKCSSEDCKQEVVHMYNKYSVSQKKSPTFLAVTLESIVGFS